MSRDPQYLLDDDVDLSIVWDTVQSDLPALIRAIEPLVPPKKE